MVGGVGFMLKVGIEESKRVESALRTDEPALYLLLLRLLLLR